MKEAEGRSRALACKCLISHYQHIISLDFGCNGWRNTSSRDDAKHDGGGERIFGLNLRQRRTTNITSLDLPLESVVIPCKIE